jgi:hypothetical protein
MVTGRRFALPERQRVFEFVWMNDGQGPQPCHIALANREKFSPLGGRRRATEGADRANMIMILWRPFRDSILSVSFPGTSVPGSGFYRPFGTGPVASIRCLVLGSVRLFNLDGHKSLRSQL